MFFAKFTQITLAMTCDKDQETGLKALRAKATVSGHWVVRKCKREGAAGGGRGRVLRGLMFDLVLFNNFINDPEEG